MYYLDYILFKYPISRNHHSTTRCDGLQSHYLSLVIHQHFAQFILFLNTLLNSTTNLITYADMIKSTLGT
jgi:hypothetical protein